MKAIVIIPSRYSSTRFPGKPLVDLGGKTMIQRVYEQAKSANGIHDVVVATDDKRIADAVQTFGGKVVMTATTHASGTDRCNEAATTLNLQHTDIIINVQGDEPFIHPQQIEQVAAILKQEHNAVATLARAITHQPDVVDSSKVKVVFDNTNKALYFSRSPIPFVQGVEQDKWLTQTQYFSHVGIYGYSVETLNKIALLEQTSLEKAESLEQLRWLQNGQAIYLDITTHESFGIDTPADLERAKALIK